MTNKLLYMANFKDGKFFSPRALKLCFLHEYFRSVSCSSASKCLFACINMQLRCERRWQGRAASNWRCETARVTILLRGEVVKQMTGRWFSHYWVPSAAAACNCVALFIITEDPSQKSCHCLDSCHNQHMFGPSLQGRLVRFPHLMLTVTYAHIHSPTERC